MANKKKVQSFLSTFEPFFSNTYFLIKMHLFIFPFSNNDTVRLARTAMLGRIGLGLGQRQMLLGQLQKH